MEELHRAAIAYYNNGDPNLLSLASRFFRSMDTDGDGIVNLTEFVRFLWENGYGWIDRNFFYVLDRNRDGGLDFQEVLTFYYIIKTRNLWCRGCGVWLTGLCFTCVECFDGAPDSYDLCSGCYSGGRFRHHHTCFLDNHILLRSRRRPATGLPNLNLVINQVVLLPAETAKEHNASSISSIRGCNYGWKFDYYVYDYVMHAWMGRLINGQRLWPHKMFGKCDFNPCLRL